MTEIVTRLPTFPSTKILFEKIGSSKLRTIIVESVRSLVPIIVYKTLFTIPIIFSTIGIFALLSTKTFFFKDVRYNGYIRFFVTEVGTFTSDSLFVVISLYIVILFTS